MKALAQILFVFSATVQAQITSIIPNLKLLEKQVIVELNSTQDTLLIAADEGLSKVSIIQRINADKSVRTIPLSPHKKNEYRIALNAYRVGAYTIEVHYKPHIYPFKMFRIKHIPYDMALNPNIRSYRAVYGVVSGFSGHTVEIKALSKKRMDELILKFETDKYTNTGLANWLKVYAIYDDATEDIYYEVD